MMKKSILIATLGLLSFNVSAQDTPKAEEGFIFTTVKENPITSVKNQNRSSTCWSFSALGFLESELLRMGKGEDDLSEMFVVHHTMVDRGVNYARYHGDSSFSPGGSFYDIMYCLKNYGLVPQEAMPGIMYGDTLPVHNELDAVAGAYMNAIAKGKLTKLTPVWKQGLSAIYDTYLGKCPETFTYQGKEYTPMTFATDACGLNMDDYVSLTSFTHHPFYTQFALEVEDNWIGEMSYNLPLDELMDVLDKAIDKGYTFSWGSDVSEIGFTRDGLAVVPDVNIKEMSDAEIAKWVKMPKTQQQAELLKKPGKEKEITQELRQQEFDNKLTTDDHGMHVIGKAVDQIGNKYFIVKNSWGDYGKYKGYLYASYPFVAYKTTSVMIHKDALPKDLKKKLGIK